MHKNVVTFGNAQKDTNLKMKCNRTVFIIFCSTFIMY